MKARSPALAAALQRRSVRRSATGCAADRGCYKRRKWARPTPQLKAALIDGAIVPHLKLDTDGHCNLAGVGDAVGKLQNLGSKCS